MERSGKFVLLVYACWSHLGAPCSLWYMKLDAAFKTRFASGERIMGMESINCINRKNTLV